MNALNWQYFNNTLKIKTISTMNGNSHTTFGRYNTKTTEIQINKILLKNPKVLRFVIYHELCHAKRKTPEETDSHDKEFSKLIKEYDDYEKERARYLIFVTRHWKEVGIIDEAFLKECGIKMED